MYLLLMDVVFSASENKVYINCSDRSMEVKLPAHLANYEQCYFTTAMVIHFDHCFRGCTKDIKKGDSGFARTFYILSFLLNVMVY